VTPITSAEETEVFPIKSFSVLLEKSTLVTVPETVVES
jgi:hypothetical protein